MGGLREEGKSELSPEVREGADGGGWGVGWGWCHAGLDGVVSAVREHRKGSRQAKDRQQR